MTMTVTNAELKQKRLHTMRKGVVAAALAIDNKFREEYGDPVFRSDDRSVLAGMRNPYARTSPYRVGMITLTYADGVAWSPKHIAELVMNYRKWFATRKLKFHYVWSVELQGNGKPHYHMIVWLPRGITPPFADEQGWWRHGMSNAIFAFSPVGYVAKYVSKAETKSGHHLPKHARLWGHGGLTLPEKAGIAYACAPRWLKAIVSPTSHPKKVSVVKQWLRTRRGELLNFKHSIGGWVCTAGDLNGWAFFGPYSMEKVDSQGLTLSHSGVIEILSPMGDSAFLNHRS